MKMVKVKTAELSGKALDWAVFMANFNGVGSPIINVIEAGKYPIAREVVEIPQAIYLTANIYPNREPTNWRPSTDWSQGGPLIDKFKVDFDSIALDCIEAHVVGNGSEAIGSTRLISGMRAIVTSKLGDEVEVPEVLL